MTDNTDREVEQESSVPEVSRSGRRAAIICTTAVALLLGAAVFFTGKKPDRSVTFSRSESYVSAADSEHGKTAAATDAPVEEKKKTATTTTAPAEADSEEASAPILPADINKATMEQLCACPGVGEATAQSILDHRERVGVIHDMNELESIYGIGSKTIELLKENFYVAEEDHIPVTTTAQTEAPTETTTSTAAKAPEETVTTTTEPPEPEPEPQRRKVDLNIADAEEIADALLIDLELAEKIVELRENIIAFRSPNELIHVEGMTAEMVVELRPYVELSPSDRIDERGVIIKEKQNSDET